MSIEDYDGEPSFLQKIGLGLPIDSKGNPPGRARTSEDWQDWNNEMQEHYPVRYFLNQKFNIYFITIPLQTAVYWIKHRTTQRYHILKTGEKPGYLDAGERMFYASFNLLKEFVEVEKAHICGDEKLKGADAGIAHLKWEMNLTKEEGGANQAALAEEVYELYIWWVHTRPNRENLNDTALAKKFYALEEEIYGTDFSISTSKDTEELKELREKYYKESTELETQYNKEDVDMFVRLAKIKDGLWT